jgi:hypothetical protein
VAITAGFATRPPFASPKLYRTDRGQSRPRRSVGWRRPGCIPDKFNMYLGHIFAYIHFIAMVQAQLFDEIGIFP